MADWVQGTVAEEGTERTPWRDRAQAILAAQRGNFFPWSPVWLMAGIAVYFALPREPPPLAFAVIAAILALLVFSIRAKRSVAARVLLLALIGFCLIKAVFHPSVHPQSFAHVHCYQVYDSGVSILVRVCAPIYI